MNELYRISPDIAAYIETVYANPASLLLDVPSPHALAHDVAERWPSLGAKFYRLVAEAAREALIGGPREPARALPTIPSAFAGLINSKDSSWF